MTQHTRGPKCSKCRQRPVRYLELWKNHAICFEVDGTGVPELEGTMSEGSARPYLVQAICRCGHKWNMKGITQITGVTASFESLRRP